VGIGGYGLFYPQYKIPTARESRYCHNFLVQLWVEGGLPALVFFLGWFYLALRSHRDATFLSTAFLFAALVFLLDSLLDYSFYFRELFLDFTLFIALFSVVAPAKRARNQVAVLRTLSVLVWGFMILALVFLVLRPQLAAAWNNRGHDAVLRQQGSDAEYAFQRALSLAPYNPWYYQQLARLKFDRGEADVALQLLAQARARNPYSAFLAHETAQIYLKLGEVERARQLEQRAVELYPTNPTYHYHLGLIYFFVGNRDAALEQAERALELEYREEQQRKIKQFIQQLSQPKTKEE
jgi:tetratricopeptide (TPR) repeat protein